MKTTEATVPLEDPMLIRRKHAQQKSQKHNQEKLKNPRALETLQKKGLSGNESTNEETEY